jgi:hypothetical protein
MTILGNSHLSKLIYNNGASQLYKLSDSGLEAGETKVLDPGVTPWTRTTQLRFGGRKATAAIVVSSGPMLQVESAADQPLFHRDYSTLLSTGDAKGLGWQSNSDCIEVTPGEHLLSVEVEGEGYVIFWVHEFDEVGRAIKRDSVDNEVSLRVGDLSLATERSAINFKRRIVFSDESKYVRLGIEHVGKSHIKINRVYLSKLIPDSTEATSMKVQTR